jgi:hypothetical protein
MRVFAGQQVALMAAILGIAGLMALAHAVDASGGGGPSCTNADQGNVLMAPYDSDADGLNDGVYITVTYSPGLTLEFYTNITFYYPNFTIANSSSVHGTTDSFSDTNSYAGFGLSRAEPNGTYTADVRQDFPGYSCTNYDYTVELYPLGDYHPHIAAPVTNRTVDEGLAPIYLLNVSNGGNNPDTILIGAYSSLGWTVFVQNASLLLEPGASAQAWVAVTVPQDEPAGRLSLTTVFAQSSRSGAANVSLVLWTTVSPQIHRAGLTADAFNMSGNPGTTLIFGGRVGNMGNNLDTIHLTLSTPPSGWSAALSRDSATISADVWVAFNVTVTLPTALTGALTWRMTINATPEGSVQNLSIWFNASINLPDFAIGPADVTISDPTPDAGQNLSVLVTVRNLGSVSLFDVVVSLNDGNMNLFSNAAVGLSGSGVATFTWQAVGGSHTLRVTADANNVLPEANETNNDYAFAIAVNTPPTPHLTAPAQGAAGVPITFSGAASTDPEGAVTAYSFDFGDGTSSDWSGNATATHAYAAPGTYTVTLKVRDSAGAESRGATSTVTVAAPAAGGTSMLLILIVVVAAAAGAGLLIIMRRKGEGAPPPG